MCQQPQAEILKKPPPTFPPGRVTLESILNLLLFNIQLFIYKIVIQETVISFIVIMLLKYIYYHHMTVKPEFNK